MEALAVRSSSLNTFSHLEQYKERSSALLKLEADKNAIHPILFEIGLRFANGDIMGSNARCMALLVAFKTIINDYQLPPNQVMSRDMEKMIDKIIVFLKSWRSLTEGMLSGLRFVKSLLPKITPDIPIDKAKEWLIENVSEFITQKIVSADELIVKFGLELIKDGDVIMTFGRSHVIEQLLLTAHEKKKKFKIIVVDNPPFHEGKLLLARLQDRGVECVYTLVNGVAYSLKKVNRVFVGAAAMLSNGSLVSRVGTSMLCCLAKTYRVPVHVFCETYKFSERSQLDSLSNNEFGDPKQVLPSPANEFASGINLRYDITPIEYIGMVVTEIGMIPPTSVPVINREFKNYQYLGRRDVPNS